MGALSPDPQTTGRTDASGSQTVDRDRPSPSPAGLGAHLDRRVSLLPPAAAAADGEFELPLRSASRLQLFMGTRLGVATLLLGGTLLLALDDRESIDSFTPRFLLLLIASIYGASLIFAVWLLRNRAQSAVALAQVGVDLLLTTALVYVTGGAGSGFTFLYGVAVLMAAMVVGPLPARLTGAGALVLYAALTLSLAGGWLPAPPDQSPEAYRLSLSELAYSGLLNVLGLLLVTLLASNLSARLLTTGGRLRAAEASAATLARLNDDIVRSLSSGLLTTDLQGRLQTINPLGAELLGAPADVLQGQPLGELLRIDLSQLLASRPGTEAGESRAESVGHRPDGSEFPIGYSVNRLVNAQGTMVGALVVFQDLSEIQRLREAATRQDRLALLGRLSAGLAHEIRNPLGSISGSVQLVRESPKLDSEESYLLGIVLDEVERLNDLVTTMLEVGRPRPPVRRDEDLRDLVIAVVDVARRETNSPRSVAIGHDVPDEPVIAHIDRDQIRQVIWNLLKNALHASPEGAEVVVRAGIDGEGNPQIAVTDEGAGIAPEQIDKLYELFYSERTHGAGIGLALVRQIVDAHGAQIHVESVRNRGATFTVTFLGARPSSGAKA